MRKGLITKAVIVMVMAVSLCVAVGCKTGDAPQAPDDSHPIAFMNYDAGMSRAPSPLTDSWDNFYVVAHKWVPGATDPMLVFPGYRVDCADGEWGYENAELTQYLKYWDLSAEKYRFCAVAPAPDNSPTAAEGFRGTTVEVDVDGEVKILGVRGNISTGDYTNSSHSPEWMVAKTERVASPLADTDLLQPSLSLHGATAPLAKLTDVVPLCFHHVMAKVDFLVFATSPIILQTFKVEVADDQPLVTRADYSTVDGWTGKSSPEAHTPLIYADYTYLDGKTVSDKEDTPTLLSSHVQIPQDWASTGRKLQLTFITKSGVTYSGYITLDTITNQTNSWLQNYHYRYKIKIETGQSDAPVVLFAVDMDTWKWKPGSSITDIQTDW